FRLGLRDEPVAHPEQDDRGEQHGRTFERLARGWMQPEYGREQGGGDKARDDAEPRAGAERPDEGHLTAPPHVGEERAEDEHYLEPLTQDDSGGLSEACPRATARVEEADGGVEVTVQLGHVDLERGGHRRARLAERPAPANEPLLDPGSRVRVDAAQ